MNTEAEKIVVGVGLKQIDDLKSAALEVMTTVAALKRTMGALGLHPQSGALDGIREILQEKYCILDDISVALSKHGVEKSEDPK